MIVVLVSLYAQLSISASICPDFSIAEASIESLCSVRVETTNFLFTCASEAQQTGKRREAVFVLLRILEKHGYGCPQEVNLPALLR